MSRDFSNPSTPGTLLKSATAFFTAGTTASYGGWIYAESWGDTVDHPPTPGGLQGGWIWDVTNNGTGGLWVQQSATGGGGSLLAALPGVGKSAGPQSRSVDSVLQLNTWYYVVWTFNTATKINQIFINAVEVSYVTKTSATAASAATAITIGHVVNPGQTDNRYGFDGYIDTLGLWSSILTPTQMLAASKVNGTPTTDAAHLIGYWPLLGTTSPEPDLSSVPHALNVTGAVQGPNSPGQGDAYAATLPFLGSVSETSDDSLGTQYVGHVLVLGAAPAGIANPYCGKIKKVTVPAAGVSDPLLGQVVIVSGPPAGFKGNDVYLGHVDEE